MRDEIQGETERIIEQLEKTCKQCLKRMNPYEGELCVICQEHFCDSCFIGKEHMECGKESDNKKQESTKRQQTQTQIPKPVRIEEYRNHMGRIVACFDLSLLKCFFTTKTHLILHFSNGENHVVDIPTNEELSRLTRDFKNN